MNITTKGHVETTNSNGTTTNSWSGNWNGNTQNGDLATIKKTNDEIVEDYKPIQDPNELNDFITPRRNMYFGHRTIPRVQEDPAFKVHDDNKEGALIDKLESLLQKDPKVIVFKPQRNRSRSHSSSTSSSPRRSTSSPRSSTSSSPRRSTSSSPRRSTSSPRRSTSSPRRSTSSSSRGKKKSPARGKKKSPVKGKKKSPVKGKTTIVAYNTPRRRAKTNVTRKKGETKTKSASIIKTLFGTTK